MAFVMTGGGALRAALKAQADLVDLATRQATAAGGQLIANEMKKVLTTSTHKRGTPTPSRPGDPPSLVSGQLRRSVKVDGPKRLGPGVYQARVGPTAIYGRIQDQGGMAGRGRSVRLPARPFVAPTEKRLAANSQLARVYRDAWTKALKA